VSVCVSVGNDFEEPCVEQRADYDVQCRRRYWPFLMIGTNGRTIALA
jgi:hypothetical protein